LLLGSLLDFFAEEKGRPGECPGGSRAYSPRLVEEPGARIQESGGAGTCDRMSGMAGAGLDDRVKLLGLMG